MPRTIPSTVWNRDRFTFWVTDIHGAILVDIHSNPVKWISDTNVLITNWS